MIAKNKIFLVFGLFGMFSSSCKKNEKFSGYDRLANKEWQLVSKTMNQEEIADSCDLDDVIIFKNDGVFEYDFGQENCFYWEPDKRGIEWKMKENFSVIITKFKVKYEKTRGSLNEYWQIEELNDSTLILKDALAEDNNQIPEFRIYKYSE